VLTIKLEKAVLTRNRELFGKMDPFARFVHGNVTVDSNVCKAGGKEPVWGQDLEFSVKGYDEEITCEIFDKESMGKDDSIGKGMLLVDNLIATAKNAKNSMDFEL
jgi:Ca2+-dependent lipid-binding protein